MGKLWLRLMTHVFCRRRIDREGATWDACAAAITRHIDSRLWPLLEGSPEQLALYLQTTEETGGGLPDSVRGALWKIHDLQRGRQA